MCVVLMQSQGYVHRCYELLFANVVHCQVLLQGYTPLPRQAIAHVVVVVVLVRDDRLALINQTARN
jgi:hypothetical protein